jgi:hypothetical protein
MPGRAQWLCQPPPSCSQMYQGNPSGLGLALLTIFPRENAGVSTTLSGHMSYAKLAAACGLIAVALVVSACGIQAKSVAGSTLHPNRNPANHSYVNDPRKPYLHCLREQTADGHKFKVRKFVSGAKQLRSIQINSVPTGPTVVFEPTPGRAESDQMEGEVEGAEVIGSALIYPHEATDKLMKKVESCLSINVNG